MSNPFPRDLNGSTLFFKSPSIPNFSASSRQDSRLLLHRRKKKSYEYIFIYTSKQIGTWHDCTYLYTTN